ncbi:MAG: 5-formyltetrahydrofolate cyclo-ligase [Planctomycetaceae bacterium]|jgi:5-formyltetrahydrofolate cyclo-ligase|nr:5-formyltetrahydrofolate cyclo-ligase [Planctomycetaceae bacterium]
MFHSEKADLRREMRLRSKEAADSVCEKSLLIRNRLMTLDTFQRAWHSERLMCFVSMPLEVDLHPFFSEHSMIVPLCRKEEIVPIRILSWEELEPAEHMSLLEPKETVHQDVSRQILPEQIDVVLVPGLAFDRLGNRLGRGKGYYDRFLRRLPASTLTVGLAWESMLCDHIPHDENDCPVKMIVTEHQIINGTFFSKQRKAAPPCLVNSTDVV